MGVLLRRLEHDDPRSSWLWDEIADHRRRCEAMDEVRLVLRRIEGVVARAEDVREKAGREALPLVQSDAWIRWHDMATMLAAEARQVLERHGSDPAVLGDGSNWAPRLAAAVRAVDGAVAEHGEPDRTVQARKRVERTTKPAQKRDRGHRFSM